MGLIACLFYYLLGGFTFIPLALWITQLYLTLTRSLSPAPFNEQGTPHVDDKSCLKYDSKQGWIYLSLEYQVKPSIMGGKGQDSGKYGNGYGVLKNGELKVYSNEIQQQCKWTLDLKNYDVSLYPSGRKEHILFSRSVALRLIRKSTVVIGHTVNHTPAAIQDKQVFFSCTRPVDKEDWYFAFLSIANTTDHQAIPFEPISVASLITFINNDSDHQNTIPWFNAILGRTFLGIYKTDRLQNYVFETLTKKTKKMKTTPGFLGEIKVRSIDLGYTIPYFTQPTLVTLDPDGTLILDAQVEYKGGFNVVVETTINALSLPLVLSLTLRSLSGTIRLKIKPPPSNRYWVGFCTMPKMKWSIVPAVSNYNVKLAVVTSIIESKIRRMMMDNMVLPNMVDIPFARSDGLGGLFCNGINGSDLHGSSTNTPSPLYTNHSDDMDTLALRATASTPALSSSRWTRLLTPRRRKNTAPDMTAVNNRSLDSNAKDNYQTDDHRLNDKMNNRLPGDDLTNNDPEDIIHETGQIIFDNTGDIIIDTPSSRLTSIKTAPTLPKSKPSSISSLSSANTVTENDLLSPSTPSIPGKTSSMAPLCDSIDLDNNESRNDEPGKPPPLPPRPSISLYRRQSHWMRIKVGGQSI